MSQLLEMKLIEMKIGKMSTDNSVIWKGEKWIEGDKMNFSWKSYNNILQNKDWELEGAMSSRISFPDFALVPGTPGSCSVIVLCISISPSQVK